MGHRLELNVFAGHHGCRRTSEQLRSNNAQTPVKTRHHQGPEDEARHWTGQPWTVCKTSIPGSNPGGASKSPVQIRSFVRQPHKQTRANWTTVDYKSPVRRAIR